MPPEENNEVVDRGDVVNPTPEAAPAPVEELTPAEIEAVAPDAAPAEKDALAEVDKTVDVPAEETEHQIPQARFNEAVGKERERADAATAELNQYRQREAQQQQAENFEEAQAKVKEMLKEHTSLLADGDLDAAADKMEAVLQLRDDMQSARMAKQADNARNGAKIEVQYDATVGRLETEYPAINPESPDFDQTVVRRVQMLVTGIMQSEGKSPADALIEATDILLKPAKEESSGLRDTPTPEVAEAGMRRTQQQIDKNIKAAEAQPPETGEVGKDHDKTGGAMDSDMIAGLSWEEFVKIPDSELAKARGDFVN